MGVLVRKRTYNPVSESMLLNYSEIAERCEDENPFDCNDGEFVQAMALELLERRKAMRKAVAAIGNISPCVSDHDVASALYAISDGLK